MEMTTNLYSGDDGGSSGHDDTCGKICICEGVGDVDSDGDDSCDTNDGDDDDDDDVGHADNDIYCCYRFEMIIANMSITTNVRARSDD